MKTKISIVIADDHTIVREGLRALLSSEPDFEVIGTAGDGREAIDRVEDLRPDVVLIDLSMPKLHGLEAIGEIKKRTPETRILVLTIHKEEESMLAALEAGVSGYCVKDTSPEELVTAVRTIMNGRAYLSSEVSRTVIEGYVRGRKEVKIRSSWDSLTSREREILKLIAENYRNREIGEMLCISVRTVEKHRQNLMNKLDLHSVSALTAFAIDRGLISR